MKYVFLTASSFLAIVAQMIAGNNFFLFNFLDLSLLLIAYWAIYRSATQALFVGSMTGLLMDAALGWPLGYNGFAKTLAAFAVGVAAKRFNLEGSVVRFVLIAGTSCLSSICIYLLSALLQRSLGLAYLSASLMQAMVTGLAGLLLLSLLDAYEQARANRTS